jgi:hypothetical protein
MKIVRVVAWASESLGGRRAGAELQGMPGMHWHTLLIQHVLEYNTVFKKKTKEHLPVS